MGQIKCKMTLPLPQEKKPCQRASLPVFGCLVVTPPPHLTPSLACLSAVLRASPSGAQLFLKKEKSLLSRSEMRRVRLDDWPPDREAGAERHSSWYLSINCWSITLCMSS